VSKVVSNKVGGLWQLQRRWKYLYDGWNLIAEVEEVTGEVCTHVWGVDLSGTLQWTGLISRGFQTALAHAVGLGEHTPPACALRRPAEGNSLLHTSDTPTEKWIAQYEYNPFGELLHATGPRVPTKPG
jgi:hypothetical protein